MDDNVIVTFKEGWYSVYTNDIWETVMDLLSLNGTADKINEAIKVVL